MFLYIFLLILILGTPNISKGTPEWVCHDPKGCPIVNNECPTCSLKTPTEKPPIIITKIQQEVIKREVIIREVAVPTKVIHQVAIPPVISFSNPRVQLAELSSDPFGKEWSWSAKVSNFTCVGTKISTSHKGTWRCNGESTEYSVTFF